jgi:hypothetical protein
MQPSDIPLNNTSTRAYVPTSDIQSESRNELSWSMKFASYYNGYPVYKGFFKAEMRVGDTHGLLSTSFEEDNYELNVPLGKGVSGKLSTKQKDGEWEHTPEIEIPIGGPAFTRIDVEGNTCVVAGILLVKKAPDPLQRVLPQAETSACVNPFNATVGAGANLRLLSAMASAEAEVGWGLGVAYFFEKGIINWISSTSIPHPDKIP